MLLNAFRRLSAVSTVIIMISVYKVRHQMERQVVCLLVKTRILRPSLLAWGPFYKESYDKT